jgi:DNA-directed RNA polymerase subunit RPC12/RpoP
MDDNLLIVCRSCGRKVLMHNMRTDSSGENMICVDCYKRNSSLKGATASVSEIAAEHKPPVKKTSEKTEKMVRYICTSCHYKFSRKSTQEVSKCPYCGKTNIVVDKSLGADKLLNEAMDKRFETW